jgi:uncharacterized Zn finger protein (UPF0148 family)
VTTHCQICLGEIPDLDEGETSCPHCGGIALVVRLEAERAEARRDPRQRDFNFDPKYDDPDWGEAGK